jgi:LmbE family N-acetylglucosaminyl deacetylase
VKNARARSADVKSAGAAHVKTGLQVRAGAGKVLLLASARTATAGLVEKTGRPQASAGQTADRVGKNRVALRMHAAAADVTSAVADRRAAGVVGKAADNLPAADKLPAADNLPVDRALVDRAPVDLVQNQVHHAMPRSQRVVKAASASAGRAITGRHPVRKLGAAVSARMDRGAGRRVENRAAARTEVHLPLEVVRRRARTSRQATGTRVDKASGARTAVTGSKAPRVGATTNNAKDRHMTATEPTPQTPQVETTSSETTGSETIIAKSEPEGWEAPQKILVILAHPDDPDFFCGATLARWASQGHEITYCLLTRGDKGAREATTDPMELGRRREVEQQDAADRIGVKRVFFLEFLDGTLIPDMPSREAVTRVIRQERPDVLVTCDPTQLFGDNSINHPDHRYVGQIVIDAVFPAAGNPLYFPHLLKEEHLEPHSVREVWMTVTGTPNTTIDVTATWDKKIDALRSHVSQIGDVEGLEKRMRSRHTPDSSLENPRYEERFRRLKFR